MDGLTHLEIVVVVLLIAVTFSACKLPVLFERIARRRAR